jgi:hypothetical protein
VATDPSTVRSIVSDDGDDPGRERTVSRSPCWRITTWCTPVNVASRPLEKYSYRLSHTPE